MSLADDRRMIGWCGMFSAGRRSDFTHRDIQALDALRDDLRDGLRGWHALAPIDDQPYGLLESAGEWLLPVFAFTASGIFLYANGAARVLLPRKPMAIEDHLGTQEVPMPGWRRMPAISYEGGQVFVFAGSTRPEAGRHEPGHAAIFARGLELPDRLAAIAEALMLGMSDVEIGEKHGLGRGVANTYRVRIYRRVGVKSVAQLAHVARTRAYEKRPTLWPELLPA